MNHGHRLKTSSHIQNTSNPFCSKMSPPSPLKQGQRCMQQPKGKQRWGVGGQNFGVGHLCAI